MNKSVKEIKSNNQGKNQEKEEQEIYNEKKIKILSPKIDVVFQALFGEVGNEKITQAFLESILKRKISEVNLSENIILRRKRPKDKMGVLDVLAKIDNKEYCDIEIQLEVNENILERVVYYWSRLYARTIQKSDNYSKLQKTIVILIAEEKIKSIRDMKYHTIWHITEDENSQKILTDKFEVHIIMLDKLIEDGNDEDLVAWLNFLNNPTSEKVRGKMEENNALKEAVEKLEEISTDEQMQQYAWLVEKGRIEETTKKDEIERWNKEKENLKKEIEEARNNLEAAKNEVEAAKNEVEAAKNEVEAAKNEAEVAKNEAEQGKLEIAKKLLEQNINLEIISLSTGLSIEKIKQLTK